MTILLQLYKTCCCSSRVALLATSNTRFWELHPVYQYGRTICTLRGRQITVLGNGAVSNISFSRRSVAGVPSAADIRQTKTLGEFLIKGTAALESKSVEVGTLVQIARERKELIVTSWRSILGLRGLPLSSVPLPLLEAFLDTLLESEFSSSSTACRITAQDQLFVLQTVHDRGDFKQAARHTLMPFLVYNGVELLSSWDFLDFLGDQLFATYVVLLDYLICFHGKEARRRKAIVTVFETAAPHAANSPEALVQLLQLFVTTHHILPAEIASHLLACCRQHLGSTSMPTDFRIDIRSALVQLSSVSSSFAMLAYDQLTAEEAAGMSMSSCVSMLGVVGTPHPSQDVVWSAVTRRAESLTPFEIFRLLTYLVRVSESEQLSADRLQVLFSMLMDCILRCCETSPGQLTLDDIFPHAAALASCRDHPSVKLLAQTLSRTHAEGPSGRSKRLLGKLAYVLSLLEVDLPAHIFPEDCVISIPADLIHRQAALATVDNKETDAEIPIVHKKEQFYWPSL